MNKATKISVFVLRIAIGWLFFYSGLAKILNPNWSSATYLSCAKVFPSFYHWLASSQNIDWVNFSNRWGLLIIGIALIFGIFVRHVSLIAIILMVISYIPRLNLSHSGIYLLTLDEHAIYILVLVVLFNIHAGRYCGLDQMIEKNISGLKFRLTGKK